MFDFNDPCIIVQMCKFEAYVQRAHIVIKFPCSYFVQWKTINNRYSICTQKRVRTANDEAIFNEKLTFYTEMVYNTKKKQYYSKETFLVLNLVSKSRPDQVKLVGRISVDLAEILNRRRFEELSRIKLNYCSVEGSIVFCIGLLNKRDSNLSVKDLDRSAFTDYFSLNPINRMMIEQSINGNFMNSGSNKSLQKIQRYEQPQKLQQINTNQYNQHPPGAPSFAKERQPQFKNQQRANQNQRTYTYHKEHRDQQVISFQNSQRKQQNWQRMVNESPRTNNSKDQSLIQKLEEKNLRHYEKASNVVEVNNREAKTDRVISDEGRLGGLNRVPQEPQTGQIRKQPLSKISSQSRIPPAITPVPLSKPTSPPSYERELVHQNSSSKFSQTSEYQNEQLLSIVQKLQQQKQEQQSMIQSLRAMLLNKNMKKKEGRGVSQVNDVEQLNRQREIIEQNNALREENSLLRIQIGEKNTEIKQKEIHTFQLIDKINKLQGELINCQQTINEQEKKITVYEQKVTMYEEQIASLRLREIQQEKIYESLKLSVSLQPEQEPPTHTRMNVVDRGVVDLMGKNKLLESFRVPEEPQSLRGSSQIYLPEQSLKQSSDQPEQPFKILISQDEKIYEQMEKQSAELTQRVRQLQEEIQIYKDLLKQQNKFEFTNLKESIPIVDHMQTIMQHQQVPFTITVSKNINIYENYQNLEQENTDLYDRIKQLQQQIQSYKELMMKENYPDQNKTAKDNKKIMVESVEVRQVGEYRTSINHIPDVTESQPPKANPVPNSTMNNKSSPFQTTPSPIVSQEHMNMVAKTFKIILTKDRSIYKDQQEQNIELSNRVIELQDEIEKYKDLLRGEGETVANKEGQTNGNCSSKKEQHYEDQGFTITLSKDKNIFQNQENQLADLQVQVHQLQQVLQKYRVLYGPIDKQPQYKISVTREENIYEEQEREIKQLLKSLDQKDQEVIELTSRLSIIQRELEEYRPKSDSGEIRININRDENIYQEQEKDIRELSNRAVELEDKVSLLHQQLRENQLLIQKLQGELGQLKKNPQHKSSINQAPQIVPSSIYQHSTPLSTPTVSCLACVNMRNKILQLQMNEQLIEEQKNLLEEEIGALEEEKFCLTSTQNQLKITIEDLRDEINLLSQENERLTEELHFVQQNYRLQQVQHHPGQQIENVYQHGDRDSYNDRQMQGQQSPQQVVPRSKFLISLPQNVSKQYNRAHTAGFVSPQSSTHHLQELPKSPSHSGYSKSPSSPRPSQLLLSLQEQNSHLRQSLQTFEQQLEEQYFTIGQLQQRIARLMHEKDIMFERDQQLSKEVIMLSEKEQEKNEMENGLKQRIAELEKELASLRSQSLTTITTSHLTTSESTEKLRIVELQHQVQTLRSQLQMAREAVSLEQNTSWLLREKQQQIQELEKQLETLNDSLGELSISYQAMQQNLLQLEEEKSSEVESIRAQYETVNMMLRQELQSIEKMIVEKQNICQENQVELRARGEEIQHLIGEIQQLKIENQELGCLRDRFDILSGENQTQRQEINNLIHLKQQHNRLQQQLNCLKQMQPQTKTQPIISQQQPPLSQQQRHKFLTIIQELKLSKQNRDLQLLPLISQKLNHMAFPQQTTLNQQPLAKMISKQLQKIKINIMRNYQNTTNVTGGVIQRTSSNKNGFGQDFKTFAEKSAMLNYLKPIEDLIKGY